MRRSVSLASEHTLSSPSHPVQVDRVGAPASGSDDSGTDASDSDGGDSGGGGAGDAFSGQGAARGMSSRVKAAALDLLQGARTVCVGGWGGGCWGRSVDGAVFGLGSLLSGAAPATGNRPGRL
jgi:hypothetical protein